jgi:hypothetical protein
MAADIVCEWLRTARNPAAPAYAIGEYGRWMTLGLDEVWIVML